MSRLIWWKLPPTSMTPLCRVSAVGNLVEFYVSADEQDAGTFTDPNPNSPHRAFPATQQATVFEDDFERGPGMDRER